MYAFSSGNKIFPVGLIWFYFWGYHVNYLACICPSNCETTGTQTLHFEVSNSLTSSRLFLVDSGEPENSERGDNYQREKGQSGNERESRRAESNEVILHSCAITNSERSGNMTCEEFCNFGHAVLSTNVLPASNILSYITNSRAIILRWFIFFSLFIH